MASGLRLADGWWTLRELGHLRLGAELAVLSGCETGRGRLGDGDELVGLANTFLAGGAEAMVVSAWRVDDDCTRDFAEIFHRSRLSARAEGCPTPTASALRAAQRQLMRERPHPAFWAPFILIGLP